MRVLLTGGCGSLGSNLAWLNESGHKAFLFLNVDTRSDKDLERAVRSFVPDVVFHLAGQVAMTTSIENPRVDFETNALGTFNILETLRLASPNAICIYSSTNKVYGDLALAILERVANSGGRLDDLRIEPPEVLLPSQKALVRPPAPIGFAEARVAS